MAAKPKYSSTFIFEVGELDDEWLDEYRVVISEVQSVYGNPILGLEHRPNQEPAGEQ